MMRRALHHPPSARERWRIIRDRLLDAFTVIEKTAGSVGPKAPRNCMPAYEMDQADENVQQQGGVLELTYAERNRSFIGVSARDSSLAEQTLSWRSYVKSKSDLDCLNFWLWSKYAGDRVEEGHRRHLDSAVRRACKDISRGLIRDNKVLYD